MTLSHLPLPDLVWYSRACRGLSIAWEILSRRWAEHMDKLPTSEANLFLISLGATSSHEVHQVRSSHLLPPTRRHLTNSVSGVLFVCFLLEWDLKIPSHEKKMPSHDLKPQKIIVMGEVAMILLLASIFCIQCQCLPVGCICFAYNMSLQSAKPWRNGREFLVNFSWHASGRPVLLADCLTGV